MNIAIFKQFRIFKNYLGIKTYFIFFISTITGFADSLGIALIVPLFRSLDNATGPTEEKGFFFRTFNYLFHILNLDITPKNLLITIFLVFLIKSLTIFLVDSITAFYLTVFCKKLRVQLFKNTFDMSYQYYVEQDSGYFSNILTEQTIRAGNCLKVLLNLSTQLIDFFIYITIALLISTTAAVILIIIGIIIFFLFEKLNNRVKKISKKIVNQSVTLSKRIVELIQSLKYFKATAQVNKIYSPILQNINYLKKGETQLGIYLAFTKAFKSSIPVFFVLFIITIQYFYIKQPITPILVSIALLYRSLNCILACQYYWQVSLRESESLEAIILENKVQKLNKEPNGNAIIKELKTSIKFNNINFAYKNSKKLVMKNINFEIPVNTSAAIIGESGAGKSTILNLILGLLNPTKGEVLIDNLPLSKADINSWRSLLGYISQETILFNDTIAANISLIFDYKTHSDDGLKKIKEAAAAANIDSFIESLPNGYNTLIGENGIKLSGGQRQRLFIARELYRKSKILIFDEATSALDYNSEKIIKNSLKKLKGKVTLIIITHRLSTLKDLDKIFVMKEGKIIESGTYLELTNNKDSLFNFLNK